MQMFLDSSTRRVRPRLSHRGRRVLSALSPVLAVVAVAAMPAVTQAAPRVFVNGKALETKHEPGIDFGLIELKNAELKTIKCENFAAAESWNEVKEGTERGFEETTGYSTWDCEAALPCKVTNENGVEKEGAFASAEGPPTFLGTEKKARRTGNTSLPWTGELIEKEPEAGKKARYVLTHHVKVWIVVPLDEKVGGPGKGAGCELLGGDEIPFEDQEGASEKAAGDELAPKWINGAKNGLNPSHEDFGGEKLEKSEKSGQPETGRLISPVFGPGYTGGELVAGGGTVFELITAE
jgi:hypothetical protein